MGDDGTVNSYFINPTGPKARGNITVDITWRASKVTHCKVRSPAPIQVTLGSNGEESKLTTGG